MIADIIVDFENHLQHGNVWLVELELPMSDDTPEDVPNFLSVDVYVIATNQNQAMYIAQCMYPDSLPCCCDEDPITEEIYASRRHRSIL